jgi:hypothetical protein
LTKLRRQTMPTRNEQVAILSMLSGDRVLQPTAELLSRQDAAKLNRDKFAHDRRQPMHLGDGFLRDPDTGQLSQDPAISEFERQKHRDALEMYDAREDAQFQRETRAAERANERAVRTGTTQLSRSLGDLPELERMIQTVDEKLEPHAGKDIPGMGGVFNALPGMTADARQMQNARQGVMNVLLKARSGAAVTPQEFERFQKEFGSNVFSTDGDFLAAWQDLKSAIAARAQNVYAGFDPEVVENYESNRGAPSRSDDDTVVDFGDL